MIYLHMEILAGSHCDLQYVSKQTSECLDGSDQHLAAGFKTCEYVFIFWGNQWDCETSLQVCNSPRRARVIFSKI